MHRLAEQAVSVSFAGRNRPFSRSSARIEGTLISRGRTDCGKGPARTTATIRCTKPAILDTERAYLWRGPLSSVVSVGHCLLAIISACDFGTAIAPFHRSSQDSERYAPRLAQLFPEIVQCDRKSSDSFRSPPGPAYTEQYSAAKIKPFPETLRYRSVPSIFSKHWESQPARFTV